MFLDLSGLSAPGDVAFWPFFASFLPLNARRRRVLAIFCVNSASERPATLLPGMLTFDTPSNAIAILHAFVLSVFATSLVILETACSTNALTLALLRSFLRDSPASLTRVVAAVMLKAENRTIMEKRPNQRIQRKRQRSILNKERVTAFSFVRVEQWTARTRSFSFRRPKKIANFCTLLLFDDFLASRIHFVHALTTMSPQYQAGNLHNQHLVLVSTPNLKDCKARGYDEADWSCAWSRDV